LRFEQVAEGTRDLSTSKNDTAVYSTPRRIHCSCRRHGRWRRRSALDRWLLTTRVSRSDPGTISASIATSPTRQEYRAAFRTFGPTWRGN
jgi:hypothetical protein